MTFKQNLNKFITESLRLDTTTSPVKIMDREKTRKCGFRTKQCYKNSKLMLEALHVANKLGSSIPDIEFGSRIVPCWIVHSNKEIISDVLAVCDGVWPNCDKPAADEFEAEFHFVLQGPSGKIVDVTPDINPKKMFRRIVLEPRLTFQGFEKLGTIPESIASPSWAAKTKVSDPRPDFFEMLDL
jgi:hypothetical protein